MNAKQVYIDESGKIFHLLYNAINEENKEVAVYYKADEKEKILVMDKDKFLNKFSKKNDYLAGIGKHMFANVRSKQMPIINMSKKNNFKG